MDKELGSKGRIQVRASLEKQPLARRRERPGKSSPPVWGKGGKIMDEWITTAETARRWGLNDSTIRRAILDGRIRPDECKKPGRDWFVKVSAIERLYGRARKFSSADIDHTPGADNKCRA